MKYQARFTLTALVEVVVDIEAASQQEAIVAGYDFALAATAQTVKVLSVSAQSAMLDSCEPLSPSSTPELSTTLSTSAPVSPYQADGYSIERFVSPEAYAAGEAVSIGRADYASAVAFCQGLSVAKTEYARRVVDKQGNKLFEMKNEVGRFVVVVFADGQAYAARDYSVWAGWIPTAKDARTQAMKLLDAGKVFAVGVVDASSLGDTPRILVTLSRSHE